MSIDPRWQEALAQLPHLLGGHLRVSATALLFGIAIGLPAALALRRRPVGRSLALGAASVVQTIPGLALLALFYPLLLALSQLTMRAFGVSISAFGFWPSVLALTLYSLLPVMRNTIAGIDTIDPELREAAKAVGMTEGQALWRVELPLALPVIMAGIRTAAVWVIGTATLSTPIGQPSLGNYIFAGLQTQNWVLVVTGCVAAALLALVVDRALARIEKALGGRRRKRTVAAIALAGALALVAALVPALRSPQTAVIGAKTFTEQYVLAALMTDRLKASGIAATTREGLGSSVIYDALRRGDIDTCVDYSGTLWINQFHGAPGLPRDAVLERLRAALANDGVTLAGPLGFENAYALVMRKDKAAALGVTSLADLARSSAQFAIAGDYEIFSRPEWAALQKAYGLAFREQRQMQPDFMYAALRAGDVDVITGYTSDGQIAAGDLVVLDDPKHIVPPYDAILLIGPSRRGDSAFAAALQPLVGRISVDRMRQANARASAGGPDASPARVAQWLWQVTGKP